VRFVRDSTRRNREFETTDCTDSTDFFDEECGINRRDTSIRNTNVDGKDFVLFIPSIGEICAICGLFSLFG